MAFFKTYIAIGWGWIISRCISDSASPIDKNSEGYTHVFQGKRFNEPHANLRWWLLVPEIQYGARKLEVVLFWHVWLYLNDIWVDYYVFLVDRLNASIVIHTRIHLDDTF